MSHKGTKEGFVLLVPFVAKDEEYKIACVELSVT